MTKKEKRELAKKLKRLLPKFLDTLETDMDEWWTTEYSFGQDITDQLVAYLSK